MLVDFNWFDAMLSSPILLVLLGLSVVTLGVVLERSWYFSRRAGHAEALVDDVIRKVRSGQEREAAWTCEQASHPVGAVATTLFQDSAGTESVEEKMQVALSNQKLLLERNLGFLGTMAAIAPLVGLLGTVWGIMRAFHDMARSGSAAPSVVAAGVAEALVTTAAGLVIAVPAVILYNHFGRRTHVLLTVAENEARRVRGALTVAKEAAAPESAPEPPAPHGEPVPVPVAAGHTL